VTPPALVSTSGNISIPLSNNIFSALLVVGPLAASANILH